MAVDDVPNSELVFFGESRPVGPLVEIRPDKNGRPEFYLGDQKLLVLAEPKWKLERNEHGGHTLTFSTLARFGPVPEQQLE